MGSLRSLRQQLREEIKQEEKITGPVAQTCYFHSGSYNMFAVTSDSFAIAFLIKEKKRSILDMVCRRSSQFYLKAEVYKGPLLCVGEYQVILTSKKYWEGESIKDILTYMNAALSPKPDSWKEKLKFPVDWNIEGDEWRGVEILEDLGVI